MPVGTSAPPGQPWYAYNRIDNYGAYPDPMGPYPKPDSNICAPAGTPITALAPGVVTGATTPSWSSGQPSVTVKLDTPLNSLATHMAYSFLDTMTVQAGQRVNTGDILGYARGSGVCTAFALTADDVYGTQTFSQYDGNPLLNPVPFLNSLLSGKPITPNPGTGTSNSNPANSTTSFFGNFFSGFGTLFGWLSNPIRILKMVVGIVLLGAALYLLVSPQGQAVGKQMIKFIPGE